MLISSICSCKFSSFDYSQLILNGADDRDESSYELFHVFPQSFRSASLVT
jgi:hypothetical protein